MASSLAGAVISALPYLADALVILGVFIMTVGVYGAIRMPDTYTKLHSMSKAVFLGVISFCASSLVTGDPAIICRAMLISAFLVVTTPISALAIARAAYLRGERMEQPGARDESGKGLPGAGVVATPVPSCGTSKAQRTDLRTAKARREHGRSGRAR